MGWGEVVSRMDAVVNLVGEPLSRWPWTHATQQRFWDSRVQGGKALAMAIQAAKPRPQVLIQASGVNYYGPHGLEPVTESDKPGEDFLAQLCLEWEASTQAGRETGCEACHHSLGHRAIGKGWHLADHAAAGAIVRRRAAGQGSTGTGLDPPGRRGGRHPLPVGKPGCQRAL